MKLSTICGVVSTLAAAAALNVRGAGEKPTHQNPLLLLQQSYKHPGPIPIDSVGLMLKSADAMLMDLANSHLDAPMASFIEQIRTFILQMQGSIQSSHDSAQQALDQFGSDFAGCNTAKVAGESAAASLDTQRTNHSDNHTTCRQRQHAANVTVTGCKDTMAALDSAKTSSCEVRAESSAKTPGCGGIDSSAYADWETFVVEAADYFVREEQNYIREKSVCMNHSAALEVQTTICLGAGGSGAGGDQQVFDNTKAECDHTQSRLETTVCSYVAKVKETCDSFSTCTNALVDAFEAQKANVESTEQQRKVEWNATERLLCLLEVYNSSGGVNAAKLQTCQHEADNSSHLTLVYPTPNPRPSPCAEYLPHPCGADYLSAEYGSLEAPAATCTPCTFATATVAGAGATAPAAAPKVFESRPPGGGCQRYTDAYPGSVLGTGSHSVVMALEVETGTASGRQWIFNMGQKGRGAEHWILNSLANRDVQFGGWSVSNQIKRVWGLSGSNTLATTFDGDTKEYRLYVDGKVAAAEQNVALDITTLNMTMGTFIDGAPHFLGCMKGVNLYRKALTAEEVMAASTDLHSTVG